MLKIAMITAKSAISMVLILFTFLFFVHFLREHVNIYGFAVSVGSDVPIGGEVGSGCLVGAIGSEVFAGA